MSTYSRVRGLSRDVDTLRREVAGIGGQLDSLRELMVHAVEERVRWQEAFEARAAERERAVDGALQDLLRQVAGATDGLREELGGVREAVQRTERERAVWRQAVEAPAARLERAVDEALQDLFRQVAGATDGLREELGLVREAVQRVEGEWAEHERAAEAHTRESGHVLVHAREQISNVLGELSDLLRDRVGLAREVMGGGRGACEPAEVGWRAAPVPVAVDETLPEVAARSTTVYYFQLDKGEEVPDLDTVTTPYVATRMAARREGGTLESS